MVLIAHRQALQSQGAGRQHSVWATKGAFSNVQSTVYASMPESHWLVPAFSHLGVLLTEAGPEHQEQSLM